MIKDARQETTELNYDTVQFQINNEDGHLFAVLSELYSRPIDSCIREICTNCIDAHIMSGNESRPFLIKLPNYEKKINELSIRDFGPGLNHEQVMDIYRVYGKSTKDKNNNVTGCLGLGSKSPYAISSVFYVRSYLNGKIYLYTCSMDNNNIPNISEKPIIMDTDEENGLEVIIPIHKEVNFTEILKRELKYFKVKPIIYKKMGEILDDEKVNIEWIKLNNRINITDSILIDERLKTISSFFRNLNNRDIRDNAEVVQLQIYYPIDSNMILNSIDRFNKLYYDLDNNEIVKNFKISDFRIKIIRFLLKNGFCLHSIPGKIAFSPSRETIKYTERTLIYIIKELNKAAKIIEKKLIQPLLSLNTKEDYFDTYIMNSYIIEILKSHFGYSINDISILTRKNNTDEFYKYFYGGSVAGLYGYITTPISVSKKSLEYNIANNYKDIPKNKTDAFLKNIAGSGRIIPIDLFDPNRLKKIQNNNYKMGLIFEFADIKLEFLEDIRTILSNYKKCIKYFIIEKLQELTTNIVELYKVGELRLSEYDSLLRKYNGQDLLIPEGQNTNEYLPQNRKFKKPEDVEDHIFEDILTNKLRKYTYKDDELLKKAKRILFDELANIYGEVKGLIEVFNFTDKKNNLADIAFFAQCFNRIHPYYKKRISSDYIPSTRFVDKINLKLFDSNASFYITYEDVKTKLKLNKFKSLGQWLTGELLYSMIHESKNIEIQYQIIKLDKFEVYKKRIEELRIPSKYLIIEKAKEIIAQSEGTTRNAPIRRSEESGNKTITCDAYLFEWNEKYIDYINYLWTLSKLIYKNGIKTYLNMIALYKYNLKNNPSKNEKIIEKLKENDIEKFIEKFKNLSDEFSIENYNRLLFFVYKNYNKIIWGDKSAYLNKLHKNFTNIIDHSYFNISYIEEVLEETDDEGDDNKELFKEIKLYPYLNKSGEPYFYSGSEILDNVRSNCNITINMWYDNYENLKEKNYTLVEYNQLTNPTSKEYKNPIKVLESDKFVLELKTFSSGLGKKLIDHIKKGNEEFYNIEKFINAFSDDNKNYLFMEYPKEILNKEIKKDRLNGTSLILDQFTSIDFRIFNFKKINSTPSNLVKLFHSESDYRGYDKKIAKHIITNYYHNDGKDGKDLNDLIIVSTDCDKVIKHFLYTHANENDVLYIVSNYLDVGYKFLGAKSKEKILSYYRNLIKSYRKFIDMNLKFHGLTEIPDLETFVNGKNLISVNFELFVKIFEQIKQYTRDLKTAIKFPSAYNTLPDDLKYFDNNLITIGRSPSYDKIKSVIYELENFEKFGFYETRDLPEQRILQICKILEKGNFKKLDGILENGINQKINFRTIKDLKSKPDKYPKNYKIWMSKSKKQR